MRRHFLGGHIIRRYPHLRLRHLRLRHLRPHHLAHRNIVQHRRQPPLGLSHRPALAPRIILDLIPLDLANPEIIALRMAEIESRYLRPRPHRKAFRQLHAGGVLGVEQAEQRRLFGVIGLRGIAGGGADPIVFFQDEVVGR
jgi:hypothetical protein